MINLGARSTIYNSFAEERRLDTNLLSSVSGKFRDIHLLEDLNDKWYLFAAASEAVEYRKGTSASPSSWEWSDPVEWQPVNVVLLPVAVLPPHSRRQGWLKPAAGLIWIERGRLYPEIPLRPFRINGRRVAAPVSAGFSAGVYLLYR